MTLSELKKYLKDSKAKDGWWVALGDNVLDEVQALSGVKSLASKYPDWEICLLHVDRAGDEEAEWLLLTAEAVEGERNPLRPAGPLQIMSETVARLRADLADAARITEILQEMARLDATRELREQELDERENFLQESEEALMMKAQQLEELRVELEHRAETSGYKLKKSA